MRVRLLSVGRDKSGLFQPAVDEYARRLGRYVTFELVELPPAKIKDPARARREEAARILAAVGPPPTVLCALDERGKALSSEAFAQALQGWRVEARDVVFVIGGDEGLDGEVRKRADRVLALGPMTLPHRLARVVLAEQLYRAFTILRGEPYHK